ncbi:MAG: quinone oxidoreductase [Deltaproteobacteria bacterium]|nr:quinone oxidoreductase [Deltaproteobacteria bacterium]
MRAIRVQKSGGPESMHLEEVAPDSVGSGQVRIRLEACGVNFIDIYQRSGFYPVSLPFTPGLEGAGHVSEVAADVTDFKVGDAVAFAQVAGAYAEEIVAPAKSIVKIPAHLTSEIAAASMLQGMTAHYLACSTFELKAGSKCLIHAAAGGVGLLLTQIAKLKGAQVFATVSNPEKAAAAKAAGADHVIDYSKVKFEDAIAELTSGKKVDVVYDSVGKSTYLGSLKSLAPRGMLVSFGQSSGPVEAFNPLLLSQNGSLFLTRPTLGHYTATREEFEWRARELFTWITEKQLKITIGGRYPLAQAPEAHGDLEARRTSGKLLLLP